MSKPAMSQCCGTCKWFDGNQWGWCRYKVPPLPFKVPVYLVTDMAAGWRDLERVEGTDCPCFERREG